MNDSAISEGGSVEFEKPVQSDDNIVKFPPFPDPTSSDFDDDIPEEERIFYKTKFLDLTTLKSLKLHCSACDKHIGCSSRNETRMRAHPMLRTLVCDTCHTFYNSGEFERGDDGSELYCRWCGQGGQVYCCSDCPHVFCAKCIRRNFGPSKIREIEHADDWKCFKCSPNCLWDLRATCWALLRFCDLRNKIIHKTQDIELKHAYQKDCALDISVCCKNKGRRRDKCEGARKRDAEGFARKVAANIISKIPPTIQVKKFASINLDDSSVEKKPRKRSQSPKPKQIGMKNPIPIAGNPKLLSPVSVPPLAKKIRMPSQQIVPNLIKFNDNKPVTYTRIRPKIPPMPQMPIPIISNNFNGFTTPTLYNTLNSVVHNDNINLSLDNLTQGLDMTTMTGMANNPRDDDDVVCTPDFPMEPLCEVNDDIDDDVQCITPAPAPKLQTNPPPLVTRTGATLPDLTTENIVQMTENDVTVNVQTGGLKFRVDPQTLSSNKMYRLPDGRIFAINANPSMPGGYSATIVAVTETAGKIAPKGATYAAKLSAVTPSNTSTPIITKSKRNSSTNNSSNNIKTVRVANVKHVQKRTKAASGTETPRECDLKVPVEWYRYNLIDAVDALEYSLMRLNKLKKETTTMYLRTRTVGEMRTLHKTLDRLLNTSSTRFKEIKDNLSKGLKQYISKKTGDDLSEDDDDVEILPDLDQNDDPIFIDENSVDSSVNDNQEVDLTGAASSEHNDSGGNKSDVFSKVHIEPLSMYDQDNLENSINKNKLHDSHFDNLENDVRNINDDDNKLRDFEEKFNLLKQANNEVNKTHLKRVEKSHENYEVNKALDSGKSSNNMNGVIEETEKQHKDNTDLHNSKEGDSNIIQKIQNIGDIQENNQKTNDEKASNKYIEGSGNIQENNQKSSEEIASNENIKDIGDIQENKQKSIEEIVCNENIEDSNEGNMNVKNKKDDEIINENVEAGNECKENLEESNNLKLDTLVSNKNILNDNMDLSQDADEKLQDAEMSEEMIETLLKDDVGVDDIDTANLGSSHVSENLA